MSDWFGDKDFQIGNVNRLANFSGGQCIEMGRVGRVGREEMR